MKKLRKLLFGAVICITAFLTTISPVLAASASAGGSTTVTLGIGQVMSTEGTVGYEDNGVIESITVTGARIGNFSGTVSENRVFVFTDGTAGSGSITVQVTLKSNAPAGACAAVYYSGGYTNTDNQYIDGGAYASESVCVVASGSSSGGSSSSETTPTSTPRPSTGVSVDYSQLKELIKEAEELDGTLYTSESWKELLTALNVAKSALGSRSQSKVDEAIESLEASIAALVLMDYSKLQDALNQANELMADEPGSDYWLNFITALNNANYMLTTNDQAEVDAAAEELLAALDVLKDYLGLNEGTLVKDGDQFCNVFLHKIWPIVALISLALNGVLGFMLVQSKKKKFKDTTPIIDYDINDDDN